MNRRWFSLLIALLWASLSLGQSNVNTTAATPEEQTGTISGTVIRKDTGEPIRFAHVFVQLDKQNEDDDSDEQQTNTKTATTDASGRFSFAGLIGGKYQISVSRNGFVEEAYGARRPGERGVPFKLEGGQRVEDLVFKLTSAGVISGRVRDENGEPVPLAIVSALLTSYREGKKTLYPAMVVVTNDSGEFRLFNLNPGKYLLSASVGNERMFFRLSLSSGASSAPRLTVYFPGTTEPTQATALDVQAGAELHSVDLALQTVKTFHIRGQVTKISPGKDSLRASVILESRDGRSNGGTLRSSETGVDGKFDLEIPSGSYDLTSFQEIEGNLIYAHREVEVDGSDVEGVTLAFDMPTVVGGHLRWDDGTEPAKGQLQLNLRPAESIFSMQQHGEIRKDGTFEITGITPGMYWIDITGDAPDAYLKSAQYGSTDAMTSLRVVAGGGSLELVVGAHGARVSGVVMNSDPVVVPSAWVALIPEEAKQKQKRLYQSAKTDASGKYEFRGVAPGNYSLFSWDQVEQGEWEDPEFMKTFEGKGVAITVDEKENRSVDLTLIENRSKQTKQ